MEEMQEKSNTLQIEQSRIGLQTCHWNQLTLSYSFCIYSQMEFLFLQRNTHIDFSKTLKYLMWIRNTNTKYPNNLHLHIFSERWKPPLVNIEIDCWEMWFQWYNTISIYHNCHIYDVINHLSRTNRTKSIMYVFHIHPHSKSEKEECIMSFL